MKYVHKLGAEERTESESTSFLLARKVGGYISLGIPNISRYQGLCAVLPWEDTWELVKGIESISIQDKPETIVLARDSAERVYQSALERFTVYEGAVSYNVTHYNGVIKVSLDMRFIHDFEKWGREYRIQDVPGGQVITYRCPRYSFCLAILGGKGTYNEKWKEVDYSYDKERNTHSTFNVLEALEYQCNDRLTLRFGMGWTAAAAIAQANNTRPQSHTLSHQDNDAALQSAIADLDGLLITLPHLERGILAGYPWFYQVYTRDEAIGTGALISLGHIDEAKGILLRELLHMHTDGRISNRFPDSTIGSADGVGWTFMRLHQLFKKEALTNEEKIYIHRLLGESLSRLQVHHIKDGLVQNGWKETWMDTTGGFEDGRAGARIEIQALTLCMYEFMAALCEHLKDGDANYYRRKKDLLADTVREIFYDKSTGLLADGISDHVDRTVRPNIFFAAYAFPELFSMEEWRNIYRATLKHIWLEWGGLSTIDKEHLLFAPNYTGENNRSYHRGDSWYFVNNIASICLRKAGFITEADKLFEASKKQLLSMGIPGHAAETSSASKQEGVGCFSQAWSASTFVELWVASHQS